MPSAHPFPFKPFVVYVQIIVFTIGSALAGTPTYDSSPQDSLGTAHLAGLVVDVSSLTPIPLADLYDSEGNLIGQTDDNGYYRVQITSETSKNIRFRLRVSKKGYSPFVQQENWADLPAMSAILHFGLQKPSGSPNPFSSLITETNGDLGYPNVLLTFSEVVHDQAFKMKMETAKADNEYVFIQIDDGVYLVNDSGWIQIESEEDLINVDNELVLPAKELNTKVKRKDIKRMTPLDESKPAKFAIYMK